MRGQIPNDVDVVLEESQIHADRVVVVELTEAPSSISCRILRTAPVNRNV